MKDQKGILSAAVATVVLTALFLPAAFPSSLPTHAQLQAALKTVVAEKNGGFGFHMWATIVDRDGVVRAVVFCQ